VNQAAMNHTTKKTTQQAVMTPPATSTTSVSVPSNDFCCDSLCNFVQWIHRLLAAIRMRTMTDKLKIATCLWFNKNAEEAAKFYAATFPNSRVTAIHKAPGDYPGGKAGDVLTVEFTVLGQPFVGLNGGPEFTFDEAISFQVFTDTQEETDRYWNAIVS